MGSAVGVGDPGRAAGGGMGGGGWLRGRRGGEPGCHKRLKARPTHGWWRLQLVVRVAHAALLSQMRVYACQQLLFPCAVWDVILASLEVLDTT